MLLYPQKGVDMLSRVLSFFALFLFLSLPLTAAEGAPADSGVSLDEAVWILDFQPVEIRPIIVEHAMGKSRLDWYLIYRVTNKGKVEHPFRLNLFAKSDKNATYADIPLDAVERTVERRVGKALCSKADLFKVLTKLMDLKDDQAAEKAALEKKLKELQTIKPGESKLCIATFGELDRNADDVTITVYNLTDFIGVSMKQGKKILEQYVLQLDYRIPGDEFRMAEDVFKFVGRKWIKVEKEVPTIRK